MEEDTGPSQQPGQVRKPARQKRQNNNPLCRKRLIPSPNAIVVAAVAQEDSAGSAETVEITVPVTSPSERTNTSAAVDGGLLALAGLGDQDEDSGEQQSARRKGSRRAAAAKKRQLPADPDMPSVKIALASPQAAEWKEAIRQEYEALRDHGVFELVDLPKGKKAISAKFVLKIKRGPSNEIERYKARYVARGFTQVEGVDFFETYSPVGSYATLRVLLAIAAKEGLMIKHVDIQCAFLNGKLEEEVYVKQPMPPYGDGTAKVWLLKKTLYGLKQAAREWHKALVEVLGSMGFVCSDAAVGVPAQRDASRLAG